MKRVSVTMNKSGRQDGFALILALLALMLLTSLGLSLSATTSTELQIATNHRWSEQARYNAEAGIEFGKQLLTTVNNWETILPPARGTWPPPAPNPAPALSADAPFSRPDAWGNPSRNYENWTCDGMGFGHGYGIVLDNSVNDGGAAPPVQYQTQVGGASLNGAFTLWIRRAVQWQTTATATTLQDYVPQPAPIPGNGVLILVAEGIAPFTPGSAVTPVGSANRATQIIEIVVTQGGVIPGATGGGATGCSSRQGQAGGSASGTNSQGCTTLDGRSIVSALTGVANLGTGNLR